MSSSEESIMQKLFSVALVATVAIAQEAPEERKFSHIVKMVHDQISRAGSAWDSKTVNKKLQNYACHCFPGNNRVAGGAGPAQDGIDSLCKKLARCHKCISDDYGISAFNAEWDADVGKYRWSADLNGDITCAANDDQFKRDLCECDAAFATAMGAQHFWDDAAWSNAMWGNRKNTGYTLNYETTCVGPQGAESQECCGTYPDRQPFQSLSHECCMDGSVATIGSC